MTGEILEQIAAYLNSHAGDAEALFLPAAFGLFDDTAVAELRAMVSLPLFFIPTMPASVPGVRTQIQLKNYFQRIGGTYLLGDNVVSGEIENGRLKSVKTANHGNMTLSADNFVIASGSFFSHGLIASQESIREPIFGLDIYADRVREEWYDKDLYSHQAYMGYGVVTDNKFHCSIDGKCVENLYAAGSILAHQNALDEGTGGGVAITTALFVADEILRSR
jgi:glycerol-3-phosphate dehydrogenase subunit B